MKKKNFIFGAILLTISAVLAKVLGAVYRIPLTSLLKAEGMGIYQLIFPIFALFLSITSSGFPIAISRIVSEQIATNNNVNAKKIFKTSIILMLILGIFFSLILILFSGLISNAQGANGAYICYFAIAPSIIFASLLSAFKGYFQGQQEMSVSAFSNVIEQLFKLVFGLLFATYFLQFGTVFGVMGACLGITLSEVIAFIYAFIYSIRFKKKNMSNEQTGEILNYKQCFSKLIKESIPITFGSLILPILAVVDSFLIVNLIINSGFSESVSLSLYGICDGIIASLISLPTVVTLSVATAIVPHLSELASLNKQEDVVKKSELAVKIVWLIALPCAVVMFLFSDNIVSFLYEAGLENNGINELVIASNLLKISSVSIIYISFMFIFTSILQALQKSLLPVKNLLIASVLKIVLTIILVSNPDFNIYGMVIADVCCYALAFLLNLNSLKKQMKINFKFSNFAFKPLFAVSLASVLSVTFGKLTDAVLFGRIKTMLILIVFGISYLFFVYFFKVFDKQEINFKFLKRKNAKRVDKVE